MQIYAPKVGCLGARGERHPTSDRRGVPPGGIASWSRTSGILPRRAWRGPTASSYRRGLGATRDFHHGLLAIVAAVLLLGVTAVAQEAQEPQPWLHVQVQGEGADGQNVGINLPLRAVGALLQMAPDTVISEGQLRIGQHGLAVSDIRQMWQELRNAGDTEFVTAQQGDQMVRVARVGERIIVRIEEDDRTVRADLPVAVVDALLSGDGETLNITAALEELSTLRGDIINVTEEKRQIRVWIDDVAEQ